MTSVFAGRKVLRFRLRQQPLQFSFDAKSERALSKSNLGMATWKNSTEKSMLNLFLTRVFSFRYSRFSKHITNGLTRS